MVTSENISQASFPYGVTVHHRPGTSDDRVLREVITKATYRRRSLGFDVRRGEVWLDLGANIGAFALYCKINGATAVCYEPDPDCFALLSMNVPWLRRSETRPVRRSRSRPPEGR